MILRTILILFGALLGACTLPALAAENGAANKADCCPFDLVYQPYQLGPGHEIADAVGAEGSIKIAAGRVFGSYWTHANWLSKQANKQAKSVEPVETGGPLHNLGEVLQGKVILGYSNLSMMQAVESAVGAPSPVLCIAFPVYETPLSWVMMQNPLEKQNQQAEHDVEQARRLQAEAIPAEIQSLSDLPPGFALGIGPEHSSTSWMFKQIVSVLGKDLVLSNGTWIGLHQQFDQGLISGLAYAAGVPNPQIKRLFRKSDTNTLIRVMGFSSKEMDLIQDKLYIHPYSVLENTYQNQIARINSASFWNYAITQCQINSEQIYELTRMAVSESAESGKSEQMQILGHQAKFWSQTWGIPFHPGSIQFFKQQGIDLSPKN